MSLVEYIFKKFLLFLSISMSDVIMLFLNHKKCFLVLHTTFFILGNGLVSLFGLRKYSFVSIFKTYPTHFWNTLYKITDKQKTAENISSEVTNYSGILFHLMILVCQIKRLHGTWILPQMWILLDTKHTEGRCSIIYLQNRR